MKTDYFKIPEITVSYRDKTKAAERATVYGSGSAAQIFDKVYENCVQHHEEFWVMLLNRANRVLGISHISKSGISETLVDIKILMQTALKAHASGIIISHNHPSGNTKPSAQDIALTKRIKDACETLSISLLDHLIITAESYMSFADEGLL